jgi:hypothetical protein
VFSQQCLERITTQQYAGNNLQYGQALGYVQSGRYATPNANPASNPRFGKRDTYGKSNGYNEVFDAGKVIIMPPLGQAPKNQPQPGQYGGGARPETNPYIANMAPENTVPVAIFPPFNHNPAKPTKCVIYSQLTDYEDAPKKHHYKVNITYITLYTYFYDYKVNVTYMWDKIKCHVAMFH